MKLGLRQRWQTNADCRAASESSTGSCSTSRLALFPDPDRDNFGEVIGLIDYDFQWHVGDRLTLLSDGFYDVFADGLQQTTFGARSRGRNTATFIWAFARPKDRFRARSSPAR